MPDSARPICSSSSEQIYKKRLEMIGGNPLCESMPLIFFMKLGVQEIHKNPATGWKYF